MTDPNVPRSRRSQPSGPKRLTRRAALTAIGATLAGGAIAGRLGTAALSGTVRSAFGQRADSRPSRAVLTAETDTTVTPPDTTLMNEHGLLIRLLLCYDQALHSLDGDPGTAVTVIHETAELVHDVIENFHEALEEGYVFPPLLAARQHVATIDTLLLQHARGRLVTQMLLADATTAKLHDTSVRSRVVDSVKAFVRMYEPHEAREDTVVFPAYRASRTSEQLQSDGEAFDQLATEAFGPTPLSTVVAQVANIERSLGIANLGQFTVAAVAPVAVPPTQ